MSASSSPTTSACPPARARRRSGPRARRAQLVQAGDLALREGLVGESASGGPRHSASASSSARRRARVARRRAAPPLGRRAARSGAGRGAPRRPRARSRRSRSRRLSAPSGVAGECLAQARDVDLQRLRGARRRSLAPQLVDQPVRASARWRGAAAAPAAPAACPAERDRLALRGPRADRGCGIPPQSDGEPGAPTYRSPKHPPSGRRSSPETARQPSPSAIGHWR